MVWTENIWCVFRVKSAFSHFYGVEWTGPKPEIQLLHYASVKPMVQFVVVVCFSNPNPKP